MPINLVKPLQSVSELGDNLNKYYKEDKPNKPKEMTEFQKEKIKIAEEKNKIATEKNKLAEKKLEQGAKANEISQGRLNESKRKNTIAEQEAERKLNKENRISANQAKMNESLMKRREMEAEANLIKEKRLLQNSKNRKKRIEAQEKLADYTDSIITTNKNSRSSLGTLKTGPQKLGFNNIIEGGGVEDE